MQFAQFGCNAVLWSQLQTAFDTPDMTNWPKTQDKIACWQLSHCGPFSKIWRNNNNNNNNISVVTCSFEPDWRHTRCARQYTVNMIMSSILTLNCTKNIHRAVFGATVAELELLGGRRMWTWRWRARKDCGLLSPDELRAVSRSSDDLRWTLHVCRETSDNR